jgi:PIN domain
MRVVLDTNVLVNASLKRLSMPGAPLISLSTITLLYHRRATVRGRRAAVLRGSDRYRDCGLATHDDGGNRTDRNQRAHCRLRDPTDDKFLELAS